MSDQLYTLYAVDAQGTGVANQIFIDQTQDVEVDVSAAHVLEEGGELLSLSLALALVIAIRAATEAPAPSADTGACRGSVHGP